MMYNSVIHIPDLEDTDDGEENGMGGRVKTMDLWDIGQMIGKGKAI